MKDSKIGTFSIGINDEKKTVLTEREFCSRLNKLRASGFLVTESEK